MSRVRPAKSRASAKKKASRKAGPKGGSSATKKAAPRKEEAPSGFGWGLMFRTFLAGVVIVGLGWSGQQLYRLYEQDYLGQQWAAAETWFYTQTASTGFVLQEVTVEGRTRTTLGEINRAVGGKENQPLLAEELAVIQTRVQGLPWVKSAVVERHLPNRLHIKLIEREPVALWQHGSRLELVDKEGVSIPGQNVDQYSDLLMVVGEGANLHAASLMAMLAEDSELHGRVVTGIRVGKRRWNLLLDNGVFVNLPEDNPHGAYVELSRLNDEYRILTRDIRVIDMRLPDRLILELEKARDPNKRI